MSKNCNQLCVPSFYTLVYMVWVSLSAVLENQFGSGKFWVASIQSYRIDCQSSFHIIQIVPEKCDKWHRQGIR